MRVCVCACACVRVCAYIILPNVVIVLSHLSSRSAVYMMHVLVRVMVIVCMCVYLHVWVRVCVYACVRMSV